ncbi:MAG: hypothetical protein ACYC7E_17180 [Armatimonadota bacterium]
MAKDRKHLTRRIKSLLIISALFVLLVLGGVWWWIELNRNPVVSVPTPVMPSPNAFDYYVKASQTLTLKSNNPSLTIDPGAHRQWVKVPLADLTDLIQKNAAPMHLFHKGFAFAYLQPPIRSYDADNGYLLDFRKLSRFLNLIAHTRGRQGDWTGAIEAVLDGIQLGENSLWGGGVMSMLSGVDLEDNIRRSCWAHTENLDAAAAQAAARRLEAILATHTSLADIYQEEKWASQASLTNLFGKSGWRKRLFGEESPDEGGGDVRMIRLYFISKRTIMHSNTQYLDALITRAKLPYAARGAMPSRLSEPLNEEVLCMLNPSGIEAKFASNEAQNALLLIALALQAYKAEHGAYPASLNALAPAYLKKLPDDPFAKSGPPRYKTKGAKYLLYSIGPDGKDDGGTAINKPSAPAPMSKFVMPDSKGDIVAGINP